MKTTNEISIKINSYLINGYEISNGSTLLELASALGYEDEEELLQATYKNPTHAKNIEDLLDRESFQVEIGFNTLEDRNKNIKDRYSRYPMRAYYSKMDQLEEYNVKAFVVEELDEECRETRIYFTVEDALNHLYELRNTKYSSIDTLKELLPDEIELTYVLPKSNDFRARCTLEYKEQEIANFGDLDAIKDNLKEIAISLEETKKIVDKEGILIEELATNKGFSDAKSFFESLDIENIHSFVINKFFMNSVDREEIGFNTIQERNDSIFSNNSIFGYDRPNYIYLMSAPFLQKYGYMWLVLEEDKEKRTNNYKCKVSVFKSKINAKEYVYHTKNTKLASIDTIKKELPQGIELDIFNTNDGRVPTIAFYGWNEVGRYNDLEELNTVEQQVLLKIRVQKLVQEGVEHGY